MWEWFYDMPTIWAYIIFVIFMTMISVLGLYIFKQINIEGVRCEEQNNIIGIFMAIISVFLGVMLSFIVVEVWNNYDQARLDATKEASNIFILYQTISALPDTEEIQDVIIDYLEYIINVEYPALKYMNLPKEGDQYLRQLENLIYNYDPVGNKELTLYNEAIGLLNMATLYRIDRIDSATVGVNKIVWWLTIIDSVLLIITCWFLLCSKLFHYVLTAITAIYISSSIFLILILSYPFRGNAGLTPEPFEVALDDILSEN